jgi:hypothetical protein
MKIKIQRTAILSLCVCQALSPTCFVRYVTILLEAGPCSIKGEDDR